MSNRKSKINIVPECLLRPTREGSLGFFEGEKAWQAEWWGMPEFTVQDTSPGYRITINFMTLEDIRRFAKVTGIPLTAKSDSAWYPPQTPLNGSWEYDGPKTDSTYPVCIPSKGRWSNQKTGKALDRLGVSYRFFVEETEGEKYIEVLGTDKVVVMPFHDLGKGSTPARNFIWDWAKANGYKRHWVVDDNIVSFARCNANRRLCVRGGGFFRAMEEFVDRYENIAIAGPQHTGFVPDRSKNLVPFLLNSRIYSCILLDTSLPYRWRGRYNEDTDLSLRVLKAGYCTLLFRALLMDKTGIALGSGDGLGTQGKAMPGGNTDNVYNSKDYRYNFAKSLKKQHPDCVTIVWRYGRWHHQVDYSRFVGNKLRLKPGIIPSACNNEYSMQLIEVKRKRKVCSI